MGEVLLYFLSAAVISFIGSLQPGPVNMAVVFTASNRQFKKSLFVAFGGSVPELFMCFVAIRFSSLIIGYEVVIKQFSIWFLSLLIPIGIWLFFSKAVNKIKEQNGSSSGFVLGFLLGLFNPQLILFWMAIVTWLNLRGFGFDKNLLQISFAFGTGAGAFALHMGLLYLLKQTSESRLVNHINTYGNKIIGIIFVVIGLINLVV